jgi:hypothetical protein
MFLTALALFTLGQAVQPPADLREQLERAAEKLKYFPTSDFLYDRIEERFIPKDWQLTWLNAYRAITTAKASHEDTVALLQHKDPAVRTLALAILFYQENPKNLTAIASMRGDKERTVPHVAVRAARLAGSEKKLYPQEVEPQTVGDVAVDRYRRTGICAHLGRCGTELRFLPGGPPRGEGSGERVPGAQT